MIPRCRCGCADIDKPIIIGKRSQTPARSQKAAKAMGLDGPIAAQKLHFERAAQGQQGTAEPMDEESAPILRQQTGRQCKSRQVPRQLPTCQPPIRPQKKRSPTQLQPLEGRHRSKRKHRERRPSQPAASGQKRLTDAEADIPHSRLARRNAMTLLPSQDNQASMPAAEMGFTMGLRPRKAEQTQHGCYARKAGRSLRGLKQGALGLSLTCWHCITIWWDGPVYSHSKLPCMRLHV